ncbi:MAG TPA: hypothetical protein VGT99_07525 [Gammaproteobacteria bacterium]|nr:hypothetical protein [Gammaproteobacteria bacterium]
MNPAPKVLFAALSAAGLLFATGAGADVRLNNVNSTDIYLRGEDVVITAPDMSEALITPDGDLRIGGKPVAITGSQRALLKKYSAGILDIQERGIRIGQHAVDMVGGMVGTLVEDLIANGADDKKLDKDMKAKAEPLKDEARALCADVRIQKQLQQQIVAELPAFKPYAVIDTDSENNCHVDDKD